MPRVPEAADVTEADRVQCRTLIETAGFHAVDYEDDGGAWERVLTDGECLVLAVWESALFGKPGRREWTLARYNKDGTLGDLTGPMLLADALVRASTFAVLPLFSAAPAVNVVHGAMMNRDETCERDVREMIRRSTVAKPLRERCEQLATAAGFEKQLAGPHDYHAWMKQLGCDRVIFIARPAPLGLRQEESWIGHHGDPDRRYWSLTFGQASPDRRRYQLLDVVLEQTLAEAIALADALEMEAG